MAEISNVSSSPYDPDKFVDREKEIDRILHLLKQPQPPVRAVVIDGDRGVGKTWLSLHLHRTVFKRKIKGITSWLFSLWSPGENYHPEGEKELVNEKFLREGEQSKFKIDDFIEIITRSLSIELPPKPELVEKVDSVSRYVQSHRDERFVLILDSAYESDWSLLEQLETHFLGNLLTWNNFVVIVTGRGRPYPWKIPYLIEAMHFGLGPFSADEIEKQIAKWGLSPFLSVDEIYAIGSGWPVFTEHLARAQNLLEALEAARDILFAVLPSHERTEIREYFEALSPLDGFGETEAELMVKAYKQNGDQDGRAICKKMNETRLVAWKNGRYEMNAPVRNILRQYLVNKDKEAWIRLHLAAYRYFEERATDRTMERFRPQFEKFIEIHAKALSDAGVKDLKSIAAGKPEEARS